MEITVFMDVVTLKNKIKELENSKKCSGTFFKVITKKRTNGEIREFFCRMGIKKYNKGGSLPFNPDEKNLLPIRERDSVTKKFDKARFINCSEIIFLQVCGKVLIDLT